MRCVLLALTFLSFLTGNAQQWEKAKAFGNLPENSNYYKVVDEAGNIYIAGNINQNLLWVDNKMIYSNGSLDLFLLKLDSNFNRVWLKTWDNPGAEIPRGMVQDIKGDLILYGTFSERFILGNDTLESPNSSDAFLAKFDSSGNVKWTYAYAGLSPKQINCDLEGNIYFNGNFGINQDRIKTTVKMNNVSLTTYGGIDIFIGCCLPNGKMKWAKNFGSIFNDGASQYFNNGCIYLYGGSSGEFYYDNSYYKNPNEFDYGFVLKMDLNGKVNWINSMTLSGAGTCGPSLITTDSAENIMVLGGAYCIDKGGYCEIQIERFKIHDDYWPVEFMARFDKNGRAEWLKKFVFEGFFYPHRLITLNSNHFVFTSNTEIYEIDSLAKRIDYRTENRSEDFKNSSEPNIISKGKMIVVSEYSGTNLVLNDIVLPKADVDYNFFVGRANFLDKKPVGETISLSKQLSIYPNPASNLLYIEFPSQKGEKYSIRLFSFQGQLMDEFTIQENLVLGLNKYKAGLYLLVVSNGKETETYKISIQH